MIRRLLHEPLVWFLLAGAGLFVAYEALQPPARSAHTRRIEVTAHDLERFDIAWRAKGRPAPTREEMAHLVDAWVHDEILFREALALGLDESDTIIKRRLVQKMQFLTQDLAELREPTPAELEATFARQSERFADPARVTFRHLYFSPDRRDGPAAARAAAEVALVRLGDPAVSAGAAGADAFMAQDHYFDRTSDHVAKDFGPVFADTLFRLVPGSWQGPIESGFGWHLVLVESFTPARTPEFEEVVDEVRTAWVREQRDTLERTGYERMHAQYEIVLPEEFKPVP